MNSYLQGLTPSEFFFHAMGGREGLIDTAVKTAETGYIQRRLVKVMESIMVKYDGTVRNQTEQLIQFTYGEDGLAGESVEKQSILSLRTSDAEFEEMCKFDYTMDLQTSCSTEQAIQILADEWEQLCIDRNILREIFPHGDDSRLVLPCHVERLIVNAQKTFHISDQTVSDLSPIDVIQGVKELIESLVVIKGNDHLSCEAQKNATMLMSILVRSSLCAKQILQYHHLTRKAFEWLCGQIKTRFHQAQVHPGEMVGVLAAQSIGEPATQMTLNTFHYAGISAKNVTLGVPRLKEIINLSKQPKTPSMTVFLTDDIVNDDSKCKEVLSRLEQCNLGKVVSQSSIIYDPIPHETLIEEDQEWVRDYYEMPDVDMTQLSAWVLRMELDRNKIFEKNITMEQISMRIWAAFSHDLNVIFTDDNADKLVLRIRTTDPLKSKMTEEEDTSKWNDDDFLRILENELLNSLILNGKRSSHKVSFLIENDFFCLGVESISKVYIVDPEKNIVDHSKKRFMINEAGSIEGIAERYLVTDGSSLRNVLSLDGVDYRRTVTNNVLEIFEVLGIEAARKALEQELNHVLSFDGSYVNYRHVALLCDVMTSKGHLMAVTRHGINRQDVGPLMKCSFEETIGALAEAAAHAEYDPLKGVSERVMLGQLANIGTGAFELHMDVEKCMAAMKMPTDDDEIFPGIMSDDAMEIFNKRQENSQTPWMNSLTTTPSYDSYTASTPARMSTGAYSPAYSISTSSCMSPASSSNLPSYNRQSPRYTPSIHSPTPNYYR